MSNPLRQPAPQPDGLPPVPAKKKGGALLGCLGAVVFFFALLLCGGAGAYWYFAEQLETFTASAPVELPVVEYAPEKIEKLEAEIETFRQSLEAPEAQHQELVLTADDINALISRNEVLRGKLHVNIVEGQVIGDVSVPTDSIPGGEGRFFNAKVRFDVSLEEGEVVILLASAEVKGREVPKPIVDAMAGQNLAKDLYKNPEAAQWLERFESITFEEDRVRIRVTAEPGVDQGAFEMPVRSLLAPTSGAMPVS